MMDLQEPIARTTSKFYSGEQRMEWILQCLACSLPGRGKEISPADLDTWQRSGR